MTLLKSLITTQNHPGDNTFRCFSYEIINIVLNIFFLNSGTMEQLMEQPK